MSEDSYPHSGPAAAQARYGWADSEDPLVEALSISLVAPAGAAIDALRPRRLLPSPLTVAEALVETLRLDDFAWGSVLAQTDTLGGWDVIVEPNGWAASMPEALARISAAGTAVNVFWNVNAVMSFTLARQGLITRTFDPLLYDGDGALPEEEGLAWGVGSPRAAALALLERITGVAVDRDWLLTRGRPTYVVPV